MMKIKEKSRELRRGLLVFAGLALLTVMEYGIAIMGIPAIFLWVIAILKAALVLVFFMHIGRLFAAEGEH